MVMWLCISTIVENSGKLYGKETGTNYHIHEKIYFLFLEMRMLTMSLIVITIIQCTVFCPQVSSLPSVSRSIGFCVTRNLCRTIGNTRVCVPHQICSQK